VAEYPESKVSKTWLKNLKKKNKIGSRRVTKVVTRKQVAEANVVREKADAFVNYVQRSMVFGPQHTFNSDLCGYNLEVHTKRTLKKLRGIGKWCLLLKAYVRLFVHSSADRQREWPTF